MKKPKETEEKKNDGNHAPLKPKKPNVEGLPNDNDPNAQYENKDES